MIKVSNTAKLLTVTPLVIVLVLVLESVFGTNVYVVVKIRVWSCTCVRFKVETGVRMGLRFRIRVGISVGFRVTSRLSRGA